MSSCFTDMAVDAVPFKLFITEPLVGGVTIAAQISKDGPDIPPSAIKTAEVKIIVDVKNFRIYPRVNGELVRPSVLIDLGILWNIEVSRQGTMLSTEYKGDYRVISYEIKQNISSGGGI